MVGQLRSWQIVSLSVSEQGRALGPGPAKAGGGRVMKPEMHDAQHKTDFILTKSQRNLSM